jgi:uncharacterized protein
VVKLIITLSWINQTSEGVLPFQGHIYLNDLLEEELSIVKLDPVQVNGKANILRPHLYQVTVEQKCVEELTCARCLTPFPTTSTATWSEKFTDKMDQACETEEDTIYFLSDGQVDLTSYVREQQLIHHPYAPVCKPDCAGLCPVCGINKNETTCSCETKQMDPRLAKLQNLLAPDKNIVS